MRLKSLLSTVAAVSLLATSASAQFSNPYAPAVQPSVINNGDLFQDVVNGFPAAQAQYASALNLAGYNGALPPKGNLLIGGDATTNLWQRGTTGASVTTTLTYGGPDRWAYWSGTNTAITVSRDSTAADIPTGYQYAFKLARTSAQTGVVQSCMAQEIESNNVYQLQGQTVELDLHAVAGANYSGGSTFTAYVVTGTGSNEGTVNLAYGLNAGGGGSSGWTGQASAAAAAVPVSTTMGRYAVVANIPTTATEAAVVVCFTPTGTAGTNDYLAISGVQLVRNASLASFVSTSVGYACSLSSGGTASGNFAIPQCTTFDRRSAALETILQQRYYYQLTESATISAIAPCQSVSTTQCVAYLAFPVATRVAPTMTYANGFATATTAAGGTLGACTTLRTSTNITGNASNTQGVALDCVATTVPAAGSADVLYNNNGSGAIKASAEL